MTPLLLFLRLTQSWEPNSEVNKIVKSSIRVIKRRRDADESDFKTSEDEISVERSTREMVSTVKSWIAELQERKRAQAHSFSPLTATTPAQQNT